MIQPPWYDRNMQLFKTHFLCKYLTFTLYYCNSFNNINYDVPQQLSPVGPDTEVHLGGAGVLLEGLGYPQDGIGGSHLHSTPERRVPEYVETS